MVGIPNVRVGRLGRASFLVVGIALVMSLTTPSAANAYTPWDTIFMCGGGKVFVSTPIPQSKDYIRDWAVADVEVWMRGNDGVARWYRWSRSHMVENRDDDPNRFSTWSPDNPFGTVTIGGNTYGVGSWYDPGRNVERQYWTLAAPRTSPRTLVRVIAWYWDGKDRKWYWQEAQVLGTTSRTCYVE
jgi:hypothetical protein